MRHGSYIATALVILIASVGCGGSSDVSDGTGSEVSVAAIGGVSNSSEGTVAFNSMPNEKNGMTRLYLAKLRNAFNPLSSAWAIPSCSWSGLLSACSSNVETVTYDGCSLSVDHAISISGSETLSWTGSACCNSDPLSASSSTPCSFVRRTLNANGVAASLVRSVGNHSVTLNTEDTSGYDQSKTGGFAVTCQGVDGVNTCEAQRQVAITGAHYVGHSGRADWDHTVSTDEPLVIQGHDSTRKVLSGVIRVQHNAAQYTSITTITEPLTHVSGCCFPTGGSVKTTFSGGKLDGKSETMSFGPSCGDATLNDSDSKQTGLMLHHCL